MTREEMMLGKKQITTGQRQDSAHIRNSPSSIQKQKVQREAGCLPGGGGWGAGV